MYPTILALHSLVRWFVLFSLLYSILTAYRGLLTGASFSRNNDMARHITTRIVHIQFLLGVWLYVISPLVDYFLKNFKTAVHLREIRFFGMEHILMMVIAVSVITIGSDKVKGRQTDREKFKTMAVWFTVGLIIILTSIPWSFSPLTSRPNFRPF